MDLGESEPSVAVEAAEPEPQPVSQEAAPGGQDAAPEAQDTPQEQDTAPEPTAAPGRRLRPEHLILTAITALAATAYAWGLDHGSLNVYYAAAVRSMANGWHDFVYGSFDPQGTISIDKLPGSLWLQALSVRAFGFRPWAMTLPDVLAGALLVPATYRAARRVAGPRAALAAALIVAATPAALAEARGNEADPISVLLIVLAAGAVLRAATDGRLRPLIAAAVWLGLAFQVKMGEAWLPAPALAAGYLVAAPGPLRRRVARVAAAGAVLVAVSLSWMAVIAATPAADRPYADGSADDSVFSQVFGYNGLGRFGGGDGDVFGLPRPSTPSPESLAYLHVSRAEGEVLPQGSDPGWNRLVSGEIGRDAGWLLPAALAAGGAVLAARRRAPRTDPERAAVIVFGGWLLIEVVAFSSARLLPPYYTAMLVPPIAVLCVLGLKTAFGTADSRRRRLVPAVILGAAGWSAWLSGVGGAGWPVITVVLALAAVAVFRIQQVSPAPQAPRFPEVSQIAPVRWIRRSPRSTTAALALAAVLAGPAAASYWLVHADGSAWDVPYAPTGTLGDLSPEYANQFRGHPTYGATLINNSDGRWDALMREGRTLDFSLGTSQQFYVVFGSAMAAYYIATGVDRVMTFGGYTGLVPSPGVDQLSALLDAHKIGFAIVPGPLDTRVADPRIQLFLERCTSRTVEKQDDNAYLFVCR